MTEFAENQEESEKQDCEWKAFYRLVKKLREQYPMLPMCICGDSLYACGPFFTECKAAKCRYLLRFKEGSIPSVYGEYQKLRKLENNQQKEKILVSGKKKEGGKVKRGWKEKDVWYDYVTGIDYEGHQVNFIEMGESMEERKTFYFLTDLPVAKGTVKELEAAGRRR